MIATIKARLRTSPWLFVAVPVVGVLLVSAWVRLDPALVTALAAVLTAAAAVTRPARRADADTSSDAAPAGAQPHCDGRARARTRRGFSCTGTPTRFTVLVCLACGRPVPFPGPH